MTTGAAPSESQEAPKPLWAVALDEMRSYDGGLRDQPVTLTPKEALAFVEHYLDTSARLAETERQRDEALAAHRRVVANESNHYDLYWTPPPDAITDEWLDATEAKMREALTDVFCDDAAAVMLTLIAGMRKVAAARQVLHAHFSGEAERERNEWKEAAERFERCDCVPVIISSRSCPKCGRRGVAFESWLEMHKAAEARADKLEHALAELIAADDALWSKWEFHGRDEHGNPPRKFYADGVQHSVEEQARRLQRRKDADLAARAALAAASGESSQ